MFHLGFFILCSGKGTNNPSLVKHVQCGPNERKKEIEGMTVSEREREGLRERERARDRIEQKL